ncbi:hypothetical protein [Mycobacterium sp. PS03-16]|uniref:hypothetical protein n=1 Tax=Mycobacterium sp. PS03-16 TaxID=2559611 RepID=UPI001ADDA91E|nr:hypothetical protein [Mycobacterium sp. PS03-16]
MRVQSDNADRYSEALRPFSRDEFGSGVEAPSEGHIEAANELLSVLRDDLARRVRDLRVLTRATVNEPSSRNMRRMAAHKERTHLAARRVEQIWDFYFELFGQRQSRFGSWLVGCDRIALDCYQYAYLGIGTNRSVPAPQAFCYMRTGFSPATFRRGIPMRRLGRRLNPFPLIQLPYHRLTNPWTLGAILHEVAHNLQNDLGLAAAIPDAVRARLLEAGIPPTVAAVWVRWNRESFADMCGVLLGGPAVVASLYDVIARSPATVVAYSRRGPHPTPYLRAYLSLELLHRLGFHQDERQLRAIWTRMYPTVRGGTIPVPILATFDRAHRIVVDAMCFTPFPSLGGRAVAQVLRFETKEQQMIEEAARRLATATDPGVVPERFLIGAARFALDRRLASPDVVTTNFYRHLARR